MALGVTVDFNANIARFEGQINQLSSNLNRFQQDTVRSAASANTAIQSIGNSLKNMAIGYVGVSALSGLAKDILDTNRSMETLRMQLTAVEGSTEGARRAFDFITQFAVKTPFEIDGLTKSFITLQNFGINPTGKVMEAITNQAAKLGGSQENLTGITLALGQAWAKGKLQGQEILQLVNQGVPVWDLLTKVTGKSAAELQKMSENGELTRETISKLIEKMGEMAKGSNALAMETLNGKISNLSDSWHQFEDTLMGDKSEGLIKSIVNSASNSLNILTRNMDTSLDAQIAHAQARIEQFNKMGVIGKAAADFSGYDITIEKNKLDALNRQKTKQEAADAEALMAKASASEIAQTADWLAEIETADADKAEKAHKKMTDAAESAAKKAVHAAESAAKAEQNRAEGIATLMANLQFEIDLSDKDIDTQRRLTEIRQATTHATGSEAAALSKLISIKYDLAEADAILAEGEKLAAKQRADSATEADRLNQKFNSKSIDFNQGLSDALDARHTPNKDGSGMIIPNDAELKRVLDQMGKDYNGLTEDAKKSTDSMSEFAVQAAHNMQTAFADFLFDPFKDGLDGMAVNFLKVIKRMAADAAAASIMEGLLGKSSKSGGELTSGLLSAGISGLGGLFKGTTGAAFNGTGMLQSFGNTGGLFSGIFHDGGIVGQGGTSRSVHPAVFAGAQRYHTGGIAGLSANEVPAILQRGELVISNKQLASSKAASSGEVSITTNVNVSGGNAGNSNMQALGGLINAKVREIIMTEKRPNGLLA